MKLVLLVIFAFSLAVTGCSSEESPTDTVFSKTPAEVVNDYWKYAVQGDAPGLTKVLPKGTQDVPRIAAEISSDLRQTGGVEQVMVKKEDVQDNIAKVLVAVKFKNYSELSEFPFVLKKEDGEWRVHSLK